MVGSSISSYYLSTGAVERASSCFATSLWHHAPPKVTSVLVLFVRFRRVFQLISTYVGLHKPLPAFLGVFSIALISICCVMFIVSDSGVVECGHEHALLL